jgi:hypothetical protein
LVYICLNRHLEINILRKPFKSLSVIEGIFLGVKYELEISDAIREIAVILTQIRSSVILQKVVRKELIER